MPFQKHVYYPLASGLEGPDAPAAAAAAGAATMACGPPSVASVPLPFFQFRPRLESVDWRRLSAIDVDKVAGAVDVLTLQENIMNITFCKLEDEKCPHCQSGVDPVLLKLIRLAQLTIEYLLHSQEFLTSQLHHLEERLRDGVLFPAESGWWTRPDRFPGLRAADHWMPQILGTQSPLQIFRTFGRSLALALGSRFPEQGL